jgi:putative transposase
LIKDLIIERPEQVWVADITYVPVGTGFNYLHLVTDAYSKKVMGYHISPSLAAAESRIALDMAIKSRRYNESLIHHSDRGLQYSSTIYKEGTDANNIIISMTENGDPYENAIAERINGILKDEFGLDEIITNADEAKRLVAQSIDIYNNQRPHLSNSYKTPNEMHQQSAPPLVTSTIT